MFNTIKSISMNILYFIVGASVYTLYYSSKVAEPVIEAGKRQLCKEPLHMHHDGCPECDMT